MEKINIAAITNDFDEFVEGEILMKKTKSTVLPVMAKEAKQGQSKQNDPMFLGNMIKQGIEKRMKLKPPDATEKFQNMLKPFKKLQSFISIKDFLEKMSDCQYNSAQSKILTSEKKQMEQTLSHYFTSKIQQHLRNKNYQRKIDSQAQWLLNNLQQNPTKNNEYRIWMQQMLQITDGNNKDSVFNGQFLYKQLTEEKQQYQPAQISSLSTGKFYIRNKSIGSRISDINQTQKKFCKITNYLSSRLKRMLINKYSDQPHKKQQAKNSIYYKNVQKSSYSTTDLNRPSTTPSSKVGLKKDYINLANDKLNCLLQNIQDQLSKTNSHNTLSIKRLNRTKPATAKTRLQ